MNTKELVKGSIICDCGHMESDHGIYTRGYSTDRGGFTRCYPCTTQKELETMEETGRNTMYFVERDGKYFVINWIGSIEFRAFDVRRSAHNIAGVRYDYHFLDSSKRLWHGYTVGNNTQIAHCKRNKKR